MTVTERELRAQIAHYKGIRRMAVDRVVIDMITKIIAEAEGRLRQLEEKGQSEPASLRP